MIFISLILLIFLYWLYSSHIFIRWIVVTIIIFLILFFIYNYITYVLTFSNFIKGIYSSIRLYTFQNHLIGFTKFGIMLQLIITIYIYYKFKVHELEFLFLIDKYNKRYMTFEKSKKKCLKKLENMQDLKNEFIIGCDTKAKPVYMNKNFTNTFVPGTTGSGKTVTLENIIKNDDTISSIILDGKGQINTGSLYDKLKETHIVFDNSNRVSSFKYNPFKYDDPTIITDMIMCLTDWSEEHYSTTFKTFVNQTINYMKLLNIKINLNNLIVAFDVNNLITRVKSSELIKNEDKQKHISVLTNLKKNYEKTANEGRARIEQLLVEGSISSDDNAINILDIMNMNKNALFILDTLSKEDFSTLHGRLILIDFRTAMTKRDEFKRVYLILDEAGAYAHSAMLNILNKGREYLVSTVVSVQSIFDLDKLGVAFRKQIVENCRNFLVMLQTEPESAAYIAEIFGTKNSVKKTSQFDGDDEETEKGTLRIVDEYSLHPNCIKEFKVGEGAVLLKEGQDYVMKSKIYFKMR